jgi:hypothetical protein
MLFWCILKIVVLLLKSRGNKAGMTTFTLLVSFDRNRQRNLHTVPQIYGSLVLPSRSKFEATMVKFEQGVGWQECEMMRVR